MAFIPLTGTKGSGSAAFTTPGIDTTGADFILALQAIADGYNVTPTDSKGNTWVQVANSYTRTNVRVRVWKCIPTSVGTGHTFTAPDNGGLNPPFGTMFIQPFSGALQTTPEDQINGANNFASTIQPGSITPSENDCIILSVFGINAAGLPISIGSGFTKTQDQEFSSGNYYGGAVAYLIQTTAAAINPTWTRTNTNGNACMQVSFKSAPVVPASGFLAFM